MTTLNHILPDLNFTSENVCNTFSMLDADGTGLITYSQFLFATLDPLILQDESLLRCHFNDLDSLKEGFLTKQSFAITLQRKGYEISEQTIIDAFKEQDLDGDGKIDFELFKTLKRNHLNQHKFKGE